MGVFDGHDLEVPYEPLADLLKKYAALHPAKTAIVDVDNYISIDFAQLHQTVNDVAGRLKQLGVGHGDRVLLLSDESIDKLIAWLGIWRIGAVVAPLNIELNTGHLNDLARIVEPKLTIHHNDIDCSSFKDVAPQIELGAWDAARSEANKNSLFGSLPTGTTDEAHPERNAAEDVSCMFCTSGTTSKPKIVVYDTAAYWLSGLSTLDMLGLNADDKTLEYRSFGWNSAQILSLMPFLQRGLSMHIARRFSHSRFFEWIQKYGLTFSAGVPTVVNMLLNKPLGYSAKDIPTLRLMTCSTAPLSPEQWVKFEEMYGITLLQLYGMSEAGWICGNRHYRKKMGTVGPPAKHQEFAIVDEKGETVAPGVEGEVTIGGSQTALGTLGDDMILQPVRGTRVKTGDLAVMDENGFVTVTGRTKDLIIRGGMNIAPVEIDNVLLAHENVLDGAAVGVPDPIYGEEVVAFVMAKSGTLTQESVIEHCGKTLPSPKVPKKVFVVAELPKSDRGKVLRDELKKLYATMTEA
ncbi:MAG: hypothetical protein RLZ98_1102 [Pseudomonadota bacterium]|jgi:acyl-coenzyme A synthetase/AMP-(fatty) acid ligase